MTFPLIILAVLSIFGGVLNLPEVLGGNAWLADFLSPVFADGARLQHTHTIEHSTEYMLMGVSIVGVLVMAFVAYNKYVKQGLFRSMIKWRERALQSFLIINFMSMKSTIN